MLKRCLKYFVWWNFWLQIKIIKFIHKPYVILVVGGTKKSFVIKQLFDLAKINNIDFNKSFRGYNTWFGVALNFLDLPSAFSDYKKWIWIYILSWLKFFKHIFSFPKFLFLEGGIDQTGEAKKFIGLLKPDIVYFCDPDNIFQDDFDMQRVFENEFMQFIEYLNKKSEKFNLINESLTLKEFFERYILSKKKYIGVFDNDTKKFRNLADKLVRKIYIL